MTTTLQLPPMVPVGSSNLKEIGYDPNTQDLYIRFQNSNLFKYENVPQHIWDDFFVADSMGTYFHVMIKGAFISSRVKEGAE